MAKQRKKTKRAAAPPSPPARPRASKRALAQRPRARVARQPDADAAAAITIVGFGSSAGGLEALKQVLSHLHPGARMAYVVVQHLAPHAESILPELLSAATTLPVKQVVEGQQLETDHVYVIPPNVRMTLSEDRLHLAPRPHDRTQYLPIDSFFISLARQAREHAVAVVLSGSASDGALGIAEIKTHGGITIAQDPQSARFDGMPRAAIGTGFVDLVLGPRHIAEELQRIAGHPFVARAETPGAIEPSESELHTLFQLLRHGSGVDFTQYKLPTIKRRLHRRMVLHRLTRVADYLGLLQRDVGEVRKLYRDILIHVTRFFRDPESFVTLKDLVFPSIVADAADRHPIRIWVPGCATGEEAYSIAIALLEYLGEQAGNVPVQIFATDISEEAIERARAGLYPESIATDVSPERLRRFFSRVDGHYRVRKIVRDSCVFARQDLTRDPPFSKLDLIVCRNVFIYLGPRLQRKLMGVFHYALRPSGFLMLGATESVGAQAELFTVQDKRHKVYTKRAGATRGDFDLMPAYHGFREGGAIPRGAPAPPRHGQRGLDIHAEVTRLLLGRYTPPAVLVDQDLQVVQTRGRTGPFLELASGDPTMNVLKLAREGLLHGLRGALYDCQRTAKPVRREGLLVRGNVHSRTVDLQVFPVGEPGALFYLVTFETRASDRVERGSRKPRKLSRKEVSEVRRLQQELTTSREYLQSIIQDLEAANEELQSANEEILSSNEELQSTNEELDTAKEELQSTNEELNTVNEELNARNDELSHVNSDLINLLAAVPSAIVIVSADLRIRRFTPLAEEVLNLIPTDLGRPIGDIKPNLAAPDLEDLTREVIESVSVREIIVHARDGQQFMLRVRPFKNQENRIDGAVLSFTELGKAGTRPPVDQQLLRRVLDAVRVGLLAVSADVRVQVANAAMARLTGMSRAALEGRALTEIGAALWGDGDIVGRIHQLFDHGADFAGETVTLDGRRLHIDAERVDALSATGPVVLVTAYEIS